MHFIFCRIKEGSFSCILRICLVSPDARKKSKICAKLKQIFPRIFCRDIFPTIFDQAFNHSRTLWTLYHMTLFSMLSDLMISQVIVMREFFVTNITFNLIFAVWMKGLGVNYQFSPWKRNIFTVFTGISHAVMFFHNVGLKKFVMCSAPVAFFAIPTLCHNFTGQICEKLKKIKNITNLKKLPTVKLHNSETSYCWGFNTKIES